MAELSNRFYTKAAIISAASILTVVAALRSFKIVDAGHFGVRVKNGKVISDQLTPDWYWKSPILDKIYPLRNNTIIMETNAGDGRNTREQNKLEAETRIHYRLDPKVGAIALHIEALADDNGESLLQSLVDQSMNAVVGERHSTEHMADPQAMLKAFAENLQWRLAQNNVPIKLDAIELLVITIGDGLEPYRVPVQLRIRRIDKSGQEGWEVEQMAGPAAVPVPQGNKTVSPPVDTLDNTP